MVLQPDRGLVVTAQIHGKPFPQQLALPNKTRCRLHALDGRLCLCVSAKPARLAGVDDESGVLHTHLRPAQSSTLTLSRKLDLCSKKRSNDPWELFGVGFAALSWSRVGHRILVNGLTSCARISRTMTPPYVFGSAAMRWSNGIRFLSRVLDGTPNAVVQFPKNTGVWGPLQRTCDREAESPWEVGACHHPVPFLLLPCRPPRQLPRHSPARGKSRPLAYSDFLALLRVYALAALDREGHGDRRFTPRKTLPFPKLSRLCPS